MRRAISWLLTETVLVAVFFLLLTPYALLRRTFGEKALLTRDDQSTYWRRGSTPEQRVSLRFRPYAYLGTGPRKAVVVRGILVLVAANFLLGWLGVRLGLHQWPRVDYRAEVLASEDDDYAEVLRERGEAFFSERWPSAIGPTVEYEGRYVRSQNGQRRTLTLPSDGQPIEVWFFGGSTMWGTGQRDERTIPSRVVREATHAGLNLRAVNYGQPGWGVWQSTLKLIEQVVDGQRPDLVIFYDGINELRPLQNARPGAPWTIDWLYGEDYRRRLEQLHRSPWGVLREYSAWHLAEHLWNLSRRRDWLRVDPELAPDGRLRVRISPAQAVSAQISTQRIYANYAAMIRTARQFAQAEGIAFAAFWQPTVFTKRLLPGETYGSEVFDERAPLVYRAIGERVNELGVNPLTDALDNASSPVLLDVCHLNESGAQIVARRVFQELKPLLKSLDGRDP